MMFLRTSPSRSAPNPLSSSQFGSTAQWLIRPLAPHDHGAVLRLNAAHTPDVAPISADELAQFAASEGTHLVALDARDEVVAYVLSFPSRSGYDGEEIRHLRRLVPGPFHYIAQVAVSHAHRRTGIARGFYAAVAEFARQRGMRTIGADVNINPPNPGSLAFHHRLGFVLLDEVKLASGQALALLGLAV